MATLKKMRDSARGNFVNTISDLLTEKGLDVLRVASNGIAIPFVHTDGTEDYFKIVISIPTGSDDEGYDGYSEAQSYEMKCVEQARKKEEQARKKEEKKKKDAERRAKKE